MGIALVIGCAAAKASATSITDELGTAGPEYWGIVTNSTNPQLNGPGTSYGNVAVTNSSGTLALNSSNGNPSVAIVGNVSLATGASIQHPEQVQGTVYTNQSLGQVLTDATNAASYFAGLPTTSAITTISNSTGTINAAGGTNVLDISSFNLSSTLVLNGLASDQFILNITGGVTLNSGELTLEGGLLPTDVILNIENGNLSTSGGLNNESVINGIVLASSSSSINMSPGLINGELISLTTGTFQMVSGSSVDQVLPPPGPPPGGSVPEPMTSALGGLGLGGLVLAVLRRRRPA